MNRRQENKLSMYFTTDGYLEETEAIWSTVPAFVTHRTRFTDSLDTLKGLADDQDLTTIGTTAEKIKRRKTLALEVADASSALIALALVTGDDELQADADVTYSDINRAPDTEVDTPARRVRDLVTARAAALADYNYSAADLAELNDALTAWQPYVSAPRQKITRRKTATDQLSGSFEATDDILEILDRIATTFRRSNPAFLTGYENARNIVDNRGGSSTTEDPM